MSNAQAVAVDEHDYLAVVFIGAGSSYGRSPDKETAIDNCMRALRDWNSIYKLEGHTFTVNVLDVQGWDQVAWGHNGFFGKNPGDAKATKLDLPVEWIEKVYPEKKRRRR
ncbi:MAG: hypothetical protein ACK5XN_21025 [Bacteroidota bacterium]|jgi:hypothetical protein